MDDSKPATDATTATELSEGQLLDRLSRLLLAKAIAAAVQADRDGLASYVHAYCSLEHAAK